MAGIISSTFIGKRIRELRKSNNMTIKELANTLNVNFRTIYTWESGYRIPRLEALVDICNVYKVSLDSFVMYE